MNDDVLLSGDNARALYHGVAERLPIVDLHNHLSAGDIADDRVYASLSDLWLNDDHYKWRAMRAAGVDEQLITGDADPWDRFAAWAATLPRLIRNPLYMWSHLELLRVFAIDLPLSPATAREIWEEANRLLPALSAARLLGRFDVRLVATTDDPGDPLDAHERLARRDAARFAVIPTFRPDPAHALLGDLPAWNAWVDRTAVLTGVDVRDLSSLLASLSACQRSFCQLGCRASDHGLAVIPDRDRDTALADEAVRRARQHLAVSAEGRDAVALEILDQGARLAANDDSVLQLHLGPLRDIAPSVLRRAGAGAGADAIGDLRQSPGLVRFLAALDGDDALVRTVLHNSNPADNSLFASVAGAFSRAGTASIVQWGPPWWFNDHEEGLRRHLDEASAIGQLAGFVGMQTDSRSILSMARHELFRRVLCDVIGRDLDAGRIPPDLDWCAVVVRNVCLDNAVRHFGVALPPGAG
jgi:glucuronate isomerase